MAIMFIFTPVSMRADQYDEVIRRLDAAGVGAPAGRLHHVAAGDTTLRVVDVWDTPEAFETFGQTLLPILQEVGVVLPPPEIAPVHNVIAGPSTRLQEANTAVVRQIEDAWNTGNVDALDDLFVPTFVAHNAVPGMPPGLEGAKMAHQMSMQAFPDRVTTIEDLVAAGDQVVVRLRMTGTNQGGLPWFGIPANGKRVDTQWISVYRLVNGKVVEHRAVMDILGMLQQLGAIPASS